MARLSTPSTPDTPAAQPRPRPRPGERRVQILQTLASLLEQPGGERVTTAALATHLGVSEAALYRQFASKAQMFEGLIDFIESSVFGLLRQLGEAEADPRTCVQRQTAMLLQFAEKNPGLARVMVGDALVLEHGRLQERMNLFFDKFEAALRQTLRGHQLPGAPGAAQAAPLAAVLTAYAQGQLQRFVRSGFRHLPTTQWAQHAACLLA
ncbi:MAG: nucleoid occlusion factor SlmA [Polaromonas sp.]|nr:nucleoid occlusion factor SlmA [Polaromonas sp.]